MKNLLTIKKIKYKYINKFDNFKYEYFYSLEFCDFFTDFLFLLKIKHRQKVIKALIIEVSFSFEWRV